MEDDYRIDYMREHLLQAEEAVKDGVELMANLLGMHRPGERIYGRTEKTVRIYLCRPKRRRLRYFEPL